MISLPAHGAVIGAWFGAWPMPLDWESPWQVSQLIVKDSRFTILEIVVSWGRLFEFQMH